MKHFPKARRYGVNVELRTKPGAVEFLHQMDDSAKAEAAQISALPNEKQTMQRLDVAFEQRFMAKLALGLGHNIFGVGFRAATTLRNSRLYAGTDTTERANSILGPQLSRGRQGPNKRAHRIQGRLHNTDYGR